MNIKSTKKEKKNNVNFIILFRIVSYRKLDEIKTFENDTILIQRFILLRKYINEEHYNIIRFRHICKQNTS